MKLIKQTKIKCTQEELFALLAEAITQKYGIAKPIVTEYYTSGSVMHGNGDHIIAFEAESSDLEATA